MAIECFNINIKNGSWWFDDSRTDYNSLEKLKDIIEKIDFVVRNIDELKYNRNVGSSYSGKPLFELLTTMGEKLLVFGAALRQRISECDLLTRELFHEETETLEKIEGISAMILLNRKIQAMIILEDLSKDFFVGKNEALNLAAEYGILSVCEFLVEHEADVNSKLDGISVLETAAKNGHARIVKLLLDHHAQLLPDGGGSTPLMYASTAEITQILLDAGGAETINNFTTFNQDLPMSALHRAAFKGNLEQIKLLCKYGADILAKDPVGRTALGWAFQGDHENAIDLLKKMELRRDMHSGVALRG